MSAIGLRSSAAQDESLDRVAIGVDLDTALADTGTVDERFCVSAIVAAGNGSSQWRCGKCIA